MRDRVREATLAFLRTHKVTVTSDGRRITMSWLEDGTIGPDVQAT